MGSPAIREVILVPFPFSDLSQAKVRPALCLAQAHRGDWTLCQITSSPYGDPAAVSLAPNDFESGGLSRHSFARPSVLTTVHESTFIKVVGKLHDRAFQAILDRVIKHLRP
jgi:mRNA interferase MazF